MKPILALALVSLFASCSNGNGQGFDAGTSPIADLAQPPDFAQPPDLTPPPMFSCGSATCPVGMLCCVSGSGNQISESCMASCPAGSLTVQCDAPPACDGNPCCAPFAISGGKPAAENVTCTSAPGDCVPSVDATTMSGMTRLCRDDADCTSGTSSSQLKNCCTGTINGQRTHFCFNQAFVAFVSGVTCP